MSTLKPYHIIRLEAQTKQIQEQFNKLRELIRLGDMQAVEELAQLKKNIEKMRDKIDEYIVTFRNTEIEIFLYALSTLLNSLLDSHQGIHTIKEERVSLPWKREASSINRKLNLSKKTSISQTSDSSRMKSHSQSKSLLSKSVSEKTLDSRQTTRYIVNKETKQQIVEQKNKNEQEKVEKSTKIKKDNAYVKANKELTLSKKIDFKSKKFQPQNSKGLGNMLTIKIGQQEFKEILKIKNALVTQISFGC